MRGCEGEEEEGERGMRDGRNLEKDTEGGKTKRNKGKLKGWLKGRVGRGGNRKEERKRGGEGG